MIGHNSSQTIFRSNPSDNYTVLSNAMLRDERLSYESRGLLSELLTRPDDWEISVINIARSGPAGRDKVYRMMRELEDAGYAKRDADRRNNGSYLKHKYMVSDNPKLLIERTAREIDGMMPLPENTEVVVPFPEKPEVAKRMKTAENKPLPENPEVDDELWQPLPENPFTANPTQTNKRLLLSNNIPPSRVCARESGCNDIDIRNLAAAAAVGVMTAVSPMAAAAEPEPTRIETPSSPDLASCWQTPKGQMAAALNAYEGAAQRQIWMTPIGCLEVAGEFRAELAKTWPLVDMAAGLAAAAPNAARESTALAMMQQARRTFGYMQQDAIRRNETAKAREARSSKKPLAVKTWADREADAQKEALYRDIEQRYGSRGPARPREES